MLLLISLFRRALSTPQLLREPSNFCIHGAPRQNRTGTLLRERDFESRASTSSARGARVVDRI